MTKSIAHTIASIRANKLRDVTRTEMLEVCDYVEACEAAVRSYQDRDQELRAILKAPSGTTVVEWARLMMVNK